jgi:SAM-dependent methyltransferase
MTNTASIKEVFCCIECGQELRQEADALCCGGCGERYPVLRDTPRILRRSLRAQLLANEEKGPERATGASDPVTEAKLRTAASFGFEWQQFHHLRAEWEHNYWEYMQPRTPAFFQGKRVLDAGCGMGRHAYYTARCGAEVIAADLSDAIDVCRENTREVGRVHTVQADLYDLPFRPESFDFIYSFGVLHHLPDPEGAFQNLLRYLKPGGEIQIYLYWWPEGQPMKRALLSAVNGLRWVTTRMPHPLLHWLSYSFAALAYAGFVIPYRVLRALPAMARWAERLPMRQYAAYPFPVLVNDQFDRFSAPIENRYTGAEVRAWLERAGLEEASVRTNWGWIGAGRKPARAEVIHGTHAIGAGNRGG